MNGLALARKLEPVTTIIVGEPSDCCWPQENVIALTLATADGEDWFSLLCASHECAHMADYRRVPWGFSRWVRWFTPVSLTLEVSAWVQAWRTVRSLRST